MRYLRLRMALALLSVVLACESAPSSESLEAATREAVQESLDSLFDVSAVERTDGISRPGGNGEPERYDVEFRVVLVPRSDAGIVLVSGVAPKSLDGREILLASKGFRLFDPREWESTPIVNVRAGAPVHAHGVATFMRTERTWRPDTVVIALDDSAVVAVAERMEAIVESAERAYWAFREAREDSLGPDLNSLVRESAPGVTVQVFTAYSEMFVARVRHRDSPESCKFSYLGDSDSDWRYAGCR